MSQSNLALSGTETLAKIAAMKDEGNEWDGCERFRLCRAMARDYFDMAYDPNDLILRENPDEI